MDEVACEVPRLRGTADDGPLDAAGYRVRGAEVVLAAVAEERLHVPERGRASAEDVGVLHSVHELVELRRIEAVLHADVHGQRRDREWRSEGAAGPAAAVLPVAIGD